MADDKINDISKGEMTSREYSAALEVAIKAAGLNNKTVILGGEGHDSIITKGGKLVEPTKDGSVPETVELITPDKVKGMAIPKSVHDESERMQKLTMIAQGNYNSGLDSNEDNLITGNEIEASQESLQGTPSALDKVEKDVAQKLKDSRKAVSALDYASLQFDAVEAARKIQTGGLALNDEQLKKTMEAAANAFKQGFEKLEQDGKLVPVPTVTEPAKAAADKSAGPAKP
jgi:hypothetical protein